MHDRKNQDKKITVNDLNGYKNKWINVICFSIVALFIAQLVMSLEIVTRDEWGARKPTAVERYNKSVPFVIIHHSYSPQACYTTEQCIQAMQHMQRFHQDERGWFDIGYQYVIQLNVLLFKWYKD